MRRLPEAAGIRAGPRTDEAERARAVLFRNELFVVRPVGGLPVRSAELGIDAVEHDQIEPEEPASADLVL